MTLYRSGRAGISAVLSCVSSALTILIAMLVWLKMENNVAIDWEWVFAPLWLFLIGGSVTVLIGYLMELLRHE